MTLKPKLFKLGLTWARNFLQKLTHFSASCVHYVLYALLSASPVIKPGP